MSPDKHPRCAIPMRSGKKCGRPQQHPGRHASKEALQRKAGRRRETGAASVRTHGYSGYTGGCRCDVCTDAKAAYMRDRRGAAYIADTGAETDPNVTHGTRFAYEERGCRCDECVTAQRECSRQSQVPAGRAA